MWTQISNPLHNLALSAAAALFPIGLLFVLLIGKRIGGHIAAFSTLVVALLVAIFAFGMPARLALLSAGYGILNGLFPIGWIVLAAVFLYNLGVRSGSFAVVCSSIESVTADRRLQALLIAFCFGAFLEGCAGFGAPVAITTGMLVGIGFQPLYAASICLLANSVPVAFGSIGIPIVTAGQTSGIDPTLIGKMVVHQLPLLSFILPFYLVILIAGWKRAWEVWPAIFVTAASYTLTMFVVATYLGPALPNILSSLVSIVCLVLFLRVWQRKTVWRFPGEPAVTPSANNVRVPLAAQVRAWTPFLLLILFVGNWGVPGVKAILEKATLSIPVSGLTQAIVVAGKPLKVQYTFAALSAAGSAILFAALAGAMLQKTRPRIVFEVAAETVVRLRNPLITIGSIVGFAYLANYSGMATALGTALTATGHIFPLVSPIIGWIGVFVSGSDTASNALFSNMQRTTATHLGVNPILTVAANTDGGVTAKMISPQSIAVATASSKLIGQEGLLFRRALPHNLALLGVVCTMTFLQAYYFPAMVPVLPLVGASAAKPQAATLGVSGAAVLLCSVMILVFLAWINWSTGKESTPPESGSPK